MMTPVPQKLVLLDAHAIIHRAYHALPPLQTKAGFPTGALYGLASMLIRAIGELRPDYLVACYDRPEATFRREVYADYKAHRPKADEELVQQLVRSRDLFRAFGIPVYEAPGFEADDIIGTIVEKTKAVENLRLVIVSGDLDTLQLVEGERVVAYTPRKGFSETILYDEEKVKERFGLAPGQLPDYKGLCGDPSDNIIGVKGIGEKTAATLVGRFGSLGGLYQKIKTDPAAVAAATARGGKRLVKILTENEDEAFFSKTLATIRRDAPINFVLPGQIFCESFDAAPARRLFEELEFASLGRRLNFDDQETTKERETPLNEVSAASLPRELAIAIWLLNSDLTDPTPADLSRFGPTPAAAREKIWAALEKDGLDYVYRRIELPLLPILARAEERGILIDLARLQRLATAARRDLSLLESEIYELTGAVFNLQSPKQLAGVLFDDLGLYAPGLKKTRGGARSTRESELLKLKSVHPAVTKILDHRELAKLLSTYLEAIPRLVDKNHRLHTKLNQAGTTTGRFSSAEPNLQNIPAGDGLGREIRRAFIASPGFTWAAFDYAQIEMRVLAWLADDPELIGFFKSGKDVHGAVAAKVFGVKEARVTAEMRRRAKVINFGIIYGMGINALRQNLGSSRDEAERFYDDYFAAFPRIANFLEALKTKARRLGFSQTYFGRRRYLPDLRAPLPRLRAAAERMAVNAPIQGTAADIVKLAMIKVDEELRRAGRENKIFFLLQVHDELIYELAQGEAAGLKIIKEAMEGAVVEGPIPFSVSVATGPDWGDLQSRVKI